MSEKGANAAVLGRKKRKKRLVAFAILLVALFGAFFWGINYLIHTLTRESTDDAFLEGHVIAISPKVAGQVSAVYVTHNQAVKKGDPLFDIDPRDLQTTLEQKKASLSSAQANEGLIAASFELMRTRVETAEASYRQAQADEAAAAAVAERAKADFERAEGLQKQKILSQQEYDTARAAALSSAAALKSAQEKTATELSRVKESRQQSVAAQSAFEQAKAQVGSAQADVKAAELNLSYTKVVAPESGHIARKNVEPASYVQVGQQLLALVPDNLWIVANFKETQLANIRPGEPAEVEIDSVPAKIFRAHVDSVQPGSGARFSLLPPENAVGNFVKVVQRVPVKLKFDEPLNATHILGPGMSVQPSVLVRNVSLSPVLNALISAVIAIAITLVAWMIFARKDSPPESVR